MVERRGIGPVYVDYLRDIVETVRQPGKRYLFWGDIAMNSPELVKGLPKDLIAVGWDYWSRNNFDRYLKPFRDAGMETWVAPGISNWNRMYPEQHRRARRTSRASCATASAAARRAMINTTWDDWGDGDLRAELVRLAVRRRGLVAAG
jgi:hexosaminidase